MSSIPFQIKPFGEKALLMEWPSALQLDNLHEILGFTDFIREHHLGVEDWEYVPVYHSLCLIRKSGKVDHPEMVRLLEQWYASYPKGIPYPSRDWELPVCYDPEFGPDLESTADRLGMRPEELVKQHTAQPYPVYGIGFLPGFVYLGGIPEAIRLPRRPTPRLKVPGGSVGLADQQTGIYPQESPGGWNILGNCPIPLFDAERDPPCFIKMGDTVRFRAVSRAEHDLHRIEAEVGIYDFNKKYRNAED